MLSPHNLSVKGSTAELGKLDCSSLHDVEKNVCWICLDGDSPGRQLTQPCKCPRFCHLRCLARWQLQSAGTKRESQCDFCNGQLPDWHQVLSFDMSDLNAPAIMNVNFEGKTYSFEVRPGLSGYQEFTHAIRQAFQLPTESELNITFTCDEPCTDAGSLLTLQGPGAYDAAVYCASVSAARRQVGQRSRSHSISGLNEIQEPDGSVSVSDDYFTEEQEQHQQHQQHQQHRQQERPMMQSHRRSRTTIGTTLWQNQRSDDNVAFSRSRHNRATSLLSLPNLPVTPLTTNHNPGPDTNSTADAQSTTCSRKGWTKVAKKVKAIYQKMTKK